MAIPQWQPGTLYLPGSLVIPTTQSSALDTTIPNADFEAGDTGWTKGTGWAINGNSPFNGSNSAEYSGPNVATLINSTLIGVVPGKEISCSCFIQHGASADDEANGAVTLTWYNAAMGFLSTSTGNVISDGAAGVWKQSSLTAVAPILAAFVAIGATATNNWAPLYVDNFQWNYVNGVAGSSLAYEAVQAAAGLSALSEPVWPTIVGNTVVDGAVTWEAVTTDSVTWEATSVLTSGSSEPIWPEESGAFISDGNIAWEAVPLRITDENCPHTKVVAIAVAKVFAGDVDVVRFCATLNARDWTSADDAGFLPTGLQQKSQVGVTAMGVYRGNLVVWSPSTFQMWQVDPDPAAMALLDAMEGIGSMNHQAVQPVSDDLFHLSALGVRTVSIAEGTNNLASGDAGVAIDTLVQAEVKSDVEPIATYYPSAGQYWLAFRTLTMPVLAVGAYLLTSTFYPIEYTDSMTAASTPLSAIGWQVLPEAIESSSTPLFGTLGAVLKTHDQPHEAIESVVTPLDSQLVNLLRTHDQEHEAIESVVTPLSSSLSGSPIIYHDQPHEAIESEVTPKDSTLA